MTSAKQFRPNLATGSVTSASAPTAPPRFMTGGLIVRGVVLRTYLPGQPDPSFTVAEGTATPSFQSVCCDVLVYTGMSGARTFIVSRAIVAQPFAGLHEGKAWFPRASADVSLATGKPVNFSVGVNPADLSGDHVLVGFVDDSFNLPVILGQLPHPNRNKGNENAALGRRIGPASGDARSDLTKFNGVVHGVESNGDVLIDTRYGYSSEELSLTGVEPRREMDEAQEDGQNIARGGNVRVFVQDTNVVEIISEADNLLQATLQYQHGELVISVGDRRVLRVSRQRPTSDADTAPTAESVETTAKLELGTAEKSAAVAEYLDALFTAFRNDIMAKLSEHTHVIPSLSLNPAAPSTTVPNVTVASAALDLPEWNPLINSSQLKIPDTIPE